MATPQQFDTVRGTHTAVFRAINVYGYQEGPNPSGDVLDIVTGNIEYDNTADVRATGDLTIAAPWPRTISGHGIHPLGNEIFLARGVKHIDGSIIWAPLGYYQIRDTTQRDAARGIIRVSLEDRMSRIIDGRFLRERVYAAGETVENIVTEVVTDIYPDATIEFDDQAAANSTLGRALTTDRSRLELLQSLVDGIGKIMIWDNDGVFRVVTPPDENIPVWWINTGNDGVQIAADRELSRDGVYNAVVVSGEGMDDRPPLRVIAIDANETSPTYFYGRFGKVPRFYRSTFITTEGQAWNTARSLLLQSLGAPYDVNLTSIVNPALRPLDPITVVYDDGTREQHVIQTVNVPLEQQAPQGITTRQSTVAAIVPES